MKIVFGSIPMLSANFKLKKNMFIIYLLGYLFCFLAGIILLYVQALNFNSKKQKIEFFSGLLILPIIFALTSWAGVIAILILLVLNGLWIIINKPIKNYWYKLLNKIF